MRTVLTAILCCCIALLFGCSDHANATAAPADDASRLAVLSPGFAATLADLGHTDRIVARHAFDIVLDKSIPVAGDMGGRDYEILVGARPTHVILEQNAQPLPNRLSDYAEQHNWEIVRIPALSLSDVINSIPILDALADPSSSPSPRATELQGRFAALAPADNAEHAHEVLLVTWVDPVGVMGPGSYHYNLAQQMGLTPLPAEGAAYITLSLEDLIRMDPPTIVLIMSGATAADPASLIPRQARERLTACREGRVILLSDPAGLLASTTLIKLAEDLRATLDALTE